MKTHNICIIGAGNISNTRHIPAIKTMKNLNIAGVIGVSEKNVNNTSLKNKITNSYVFEKGKGIYEQLEKLSWFKDIDSVVIGIPPQDHFEVAKACLLLNKHVLIEKPMVMNTTEAKELGDISKSNKLILNVMHNFQFADNFMKLEKRINKGEFGEIISFFEVQYTNRNRRLPVWYNDLPLGLFYDEAAHFLYLLDRLGGKVEIINTNAFYGKDKSENTPMLLNTDMIAGEKPVNLLINFNSPICEWALIISCEKKLLIYDFFRDIVITVPNDEEHRAKNVITTSWMMTFHHWKGTIMNGFKMLTGRLLYGHDVVISKFIKAIETGQSDPSIDSQSGYRNVESMNEIVSQVHKKYNIN
ncbi:Gfo/Idh/MocA family oxidoreductase [Paenibacillus sp. FSL R5-0912]|uniref:Gfo/Idh/MocA family protein n=1 Tax=Paenibacillus sp. FSL R5-0912 TaxID=1536771 RepID=UPI0004F83C75|nr:Gfo/Idh/MocA family oxidoreductase [Paenibacillus sp. FSL R5-0912]AIQ43944.1 hypothetical protein R50912_31105 [Paenibacillus sp. FSL R5-0912]